MTKSYNITDRRLPLSLLPVYRENQPHPFSVLIPVKNRFLLLFLSYFDSNFDHDHLDFSEQWPMRYQPPCLNPLHLSNKGVSGPTLHPWILVSTFLYENLAFYARHNLESDVAILYYFTPLTNDVLLLHAVW